MRVDRHVAFELAEMAGEPGSVGTLDVADDAYRRRRRLRRDDGQHSHWCLPRSLSHPTLSVPANFTAFCT